MFKSLWIIAYHEIITTLRQAYSWITPLLFFVMVVCLFPLALGPDESTLNKLAPGIIWVSALLAVVMSIGNLFRHDEECGHLDLVILSSYPLTIIVFCKLVSHWITHCLPLILVSPLLGILLHLNAHEEWVLVISLLLGTPVLVLLGAVGAALVVGIRSHGLLLPLLIMPLYIPVLIFGTGVMIAASVNSPLAGYFAMLGALSLISLAFAPLLTSAALRIGVNQ